MASFFGVGSVGLGYLPVRRVKGKREPRLGALHFCIDLSTDSDDTTMNVQSCYASCDLCSIAQCELCKLCML